MVFPCFNLFGLLVPPGVFGLAPSDLTAFWSFEVHSAPQSSAPRNSSVAVAVPSDDTLFCELQKLPLSVPYCVLGRFGLALTVSFDRPEDNDLEDLMREDRVGVWSLESGGGGALLFALVAEVVWRLG